MLRALPLMLAGACLAGCGGGTGDAVEAAEGWLDAVASKDAARACEAMTESAARAVAVKYAGRPSDAGCAEVMERYVEEFDPRKARTLQEAGLEAEGATEDGRVGVFPAARRHQFEVLLMEEVDGDWRVVSVGIPPTGASGGPS